MAFDKTKKQLTKALNTVERTQGCWNCTGFSREIAKKAWESKRHKELDYAMSIALNDPAGEDSSAVRQIRATIDKMDHSIAAGIFGVCLRGGSEADFVHNAYLCDKWAAAVGASVAREGAAPDKLPEELMAEVESKKDS